MLGSRVYECNVTLEKLSQAPRGYQSSAEERERGTRSNVDVQNNLLRSPKGKTHSFFYAECVFLKVLADGHVKISAHKMLLLKEEPHVIEEHCMSTSH